MATALSQVKAATGKKGGAKKGKKNRKLDRMRNRASHKAYNAQRRDLRNKARKLKRHLDNQPKDTVARVAYERVK